MGNRILLADDSITIQKVVNLTFTDEGIEVVAVSNGDMAEKRLAEVQPDLVLADIFMPGKNGYELCEAIKESAQFNHIPVVLLVGAFEPFDQAEARRVKADAHLTKPFESRTLVETVRRLIAASSKPRTAPLPPAPEVQSAPVAPPHSAPLPSAPRVSAPLPSAPLTPIPVEPRSTMPMVQPFNLDLPARANEAAPPAFAPPAMVTPVLGATMPVDNYYGSSEDPFAMPIEVQTAEAPVTEPAFSASGNLLRRTDDLTFADNQPPFEPLGLEDIFAESAAASKSEHAELSEQGQEPGSSVPSKFGYATEEVLLDLEHTAATMSKATHESFAFDIEEREPASVDATDVHPESASVQLGNEEHDVLKTTLLKEPAPTALKEPAVNTNPLEMPQATAASHVTEPAYVVSDQPVDEAALFNVDDPLGDILDEGMPAAVAHVAPAVVESPVFDSTPEAVFAPQEEVSSANEVAVQAEEPPAVSAEAPVDFDVQFPVSPMAEAAAPEPMFTESAFEMEMPSVAPAPTSETGFGFTSADEMPEVVEAMPSAEEARFTTSSMWTETESRFAAIDIEATPVEESAEAEASAAPAEPAESFTFNEEASVEEPQSSSSVERAEAIEPVAPQMESTAVAEPTVSAPSQEAPAATNGHTDMPAVELSPALIDEIIRRVVAQVSESVVREIAWEVVPDCVERVVKDLTAQEVSRR